MHKLFFYYNSLNIDKNPKKNKNLYAKEQNYNLTSLAKCLDIPHLCIYMQQNMDQNSSSSN